MSPHNNVMQYAPIFPLHKIVDIASSLKHNKQGIAKGEKRMAISIINEFDSEWTPPPPSIFII